MTETETVMALVRSFAGRSVTEDEETALAALVPVAEARWRARLRTDAAEDPTQPLRIACAWTALAWLAGAARGGGGYDVRAFTAGEVSVRTGSAEGQDVCGRSLLRQAEALMAPYVTDGAFFFEGVCG